MLNPTANRLVPMASHDRAPWQHHQQAILSWAAAEPVKLDLRLERIWMVANVECRV